MLKKIVLFSLLFMSLLVDTGYAIDNIEFWGIRVFDPQKPFGLVSLEIATKAFEIENKDEKGVTYKRDANTSDDSISCYALVNENVIAMSIINNSKMPIEFNVYTDKYYSISKDGSFYKLTPVKEVYPEVLNPKRAVPFVLTLNDVSYTGIEYLMILIDNGRCCIFLKRIKNIKK